MLWFYFFALQQQVSVVAVTDILAETDDYFPDPDEIVAVMHNIGLTYKKPGPSCR